MKCCWFIPASVVELSQMAMNVRKFNSSHYDKEKKLYAPEMAQREEKCFPIITKSYSYGQQRKTITKSLNLPSRQESKCTSNLQKKAFRLPQINVKRESFSVCQRYHSRDNLCKTNKFDNNSSSFHSFAAKKVTFQDTAKLPGDGPDLYSSKRLLQSLRILDLDISRKKPRFQRDNSLRICPVELSPRPTRNIIRKDTITLSKPRIKATYPTLRLTTIDKNAIFTFSPSPSVSFESLDSIIGGPPTLTHPPPDILSSRSPSELELTPPPTP